MSKIVGRKVKYVDCEGSHPPHIAGESLDRGAVGHIKIVLDTATKYDVCVEFSGGATEFFYVGELKYLNGKEVKL